jgi:hypothetical protein
MPLRTARNATTLHFRCPTLDVYLLLFEVTALFCLVGNTLFLLLKLVGPSSLYRLALRHGISPCYHTSALSTWQG